MNIPWIPLTNRHIELIRRSSLGVATGIAAFAWSLSGSPADAQQRALQHDGRSFEVVPAERMSSVFQTSCDDIIVSEFDQNFPLVQGSQYPGSSCGNGECNGQCGGNCNESFGRGALAGFGLHGRNRSGCNDGCATCNPFCYGRVEAVYMRRGNLDNFTRSQTPGLRLDEPDFEAAPRITIGTVPDCVSGYEASFVGPLNFDTSRTAFGARGATLLGDTEQADGIFRLFDDPAITNPATIPQSVQVQRYQSNYWSVEASKTSMAWDIAKLLIGPRYIRFDEQYDYFGSSTNASSSPGAPIKESGGIYSRSRNNLFGLQIGADVFNPICQSTSAYFRGRAGGYYNDADSTTYVNNIVSLAPTNRTRYGGSDHHSGFAAMFELGGGLQYQISEMFSIQGGGELWYLSRVATAEDQIPGDVGIGAGYRGTNASDDVFFAGFNVGATMKY